ncbi:MAG: hypothetical protein EOP24_24080 [Hyphomicrobiales bacterium]|nr:MAG: hypothetical protein EOP24_24080 [Hyphomicrobiales bacterium]
MALEEQLLEEFRIRLRAETEDGAEGERQLDLDVALAEVILADLEEAGVLTEHQLCPYEDTSGQRRCRVIAYSLPEGETRLDLVLSTYRSAADPEGIPNGELSQLAGLAARFFDYVAKGDVSRFRECPEAWDAVEAIRQRLPEIEDVRVLLLSNGVMRDRNVEPLNIAGRDVEFSAWDLERLHRASGEEVTRERIDIDLVKMNGSALTALEMRPPPKEYQTFLVVVPGQLLFKLYDFFGARLFEFNVRSFLQARGTVNKGLRDTLRTEPERFLAYNNGITATADEIDVGIENGETVIRRLKGLQIVNGAQTTASIHRAAKEKIDISRVAVSMKLTRVEPSKLAEFVPLIAKYANTQNPVQLADLSANNDFHIAIERLSEKVWAPGEDTRWFYERARGAYEVARLRAGTTSAKRREFDADCPKSQKFTKTDLAKVWMSWWGKPDVVSRGAQKNFASFMAQLSEGADAEMRPTEDFYRDTVSLIILLKGIQSAVRKSALPSYGANVVTYMLAKLKKTFDTGVSLGEIWEQQQLSFEMSNLLLSWAHEIHAGIVEGAGARNVTEYAKKEECWSRLQELQLTLPDTIPAELGGAAVAPVLAPRQDNSDDTAIDRCTGLSGAEWATIFAWAAASPAVTDFDRSVMHTLLGYAVKGWHQRPSGKQARIADRVLDAAVREKVLEVS